MSPVVSDGAFGGNPLSVGWSKALIYGVNGYQQPHKATVSVSWNIALQAMNCAADALQ